MCVPVGPEVGAIVFPEPSGNPNISHAIIGGRMFFNEEYVRQMVSDAIAMEREACAKIAEQVVPTTQYELEEWDKMIAAAIRART